jgi:hypothetical protein
MKFLKRDTKLAKCDVCGQSIWLDEYGNGDECSNCTWRQSEEAQDHPDRAGVNNIPSLNSARKLYKQGNPLIADFDDFMQAFKSYGELEFTYRKIVYGVYAPKGTIILFESESGKEIGFFKDTDEFRNRANIDGVLLKDLWGKVENTDFLQ